MGFLLVLLLGFSPDASADNTGQTEALRVMRSDEQQLCTDLWACQAEALRRGVGAQVVNLINDARQAVARADEHPNDYSALQAAVLALGRDTDSCTLQVQSFTRPECRRDPFAGRTEPLTVHGFIGEDSKVCETRDMFPFQYHLSRRGRRYTAAIKLCMVPVDPPKEYADFFQRTHVSQSDGWGPITAGWKRELERFWRTDSGIHFRLDVNFVVASRRAECPAASDQIVDLVGKADRSNYTTWYLGDHGFDSGNGFYTLRHEIGHHLGLIDEYNEGDSVSLCQPDVSSENADSIMGFSGMGSSASDEVDWSRMRPKRKHFKQIVSNIVSNNFRPSGAVNYDTATGLAYTRACPDRDDHFRALSDQCSDDAPASLHCESDSTVYAVDHFR